MEQFFCGCGCWGFDQRDAISQSKRPGCRRVLDLAFGLRKGNTSTPGQVPQCHLAAATHSKVELEAIPVKKKKKPFVNARTATRNGAT